MDKNIEQTIADIVSRRQPLSNKANKIYNLVKDSGGFVKTWNITFSKAIGISSTGTDEFLRYLDECIEKDYVRVLFKDNNKEKNGFFTLEYFHLEVLPRLIEQNSSIYQLPIRYNEHN